MFAHVTVEDANSALTELFQAALVCNQVLGLAVVSSSCYEVIHELPIQPLF